MHHSLTLRLDRQHKKAHCSGVSDPPPWAADKLEVVTSHRAPSEVISLCWFNPDRSNNTEHLLELQLKYCSLPTRVFEHIQSNMKNRPMNENNDVIIMTCVSNQVQDSINPNAVSTAFLHMGDVFISSCSHAVLSRPLPCHQGPYVPFVGWV